MALLLREDGTREEVKPAKGKCFSLPELQSLVGGYIEFARTRDHHIMIIDEEGKLKGKQVNLIASALYLYGEHDPIVGAAVWGKVEEFEEEEEEEEDE